MTKRINITLQANGEGTLECVGATTYHCLGNPATPYPADVTITGQEGVDKFRERFSSEFQVNMPWAVLLGWERGLFIHEGADTTESNGGVTAGCIHLASPNAEAVYNWVDGRTRITTTVVGVVPPLAAVDTGAKTFRGKVSQMISTKVLSGIDLATSLPTLVILALFVFLFRKGFSGDLSDIGFSRGLISLVFACGTIALALALGVSTLFPARDGDDAGGRFERGREVLTVLVGIFGTILGFYFGSAGTDRSAPTIYSVSPAIVSASASANAEIVGMGMSKVDALLVGETLVTPDADRSGDGGVLKFTIPSSATIDPRMLPIRAIESASGRVSNPFFVEVKAKIAAEDPKATDE